MEYKKYIVFCMCEYYPSGGLDDIKNSFDSIEEAKQYAISALSKGYDWFHIVDRDTWEITNQYEGE